MYEAAEVAIEATVIVSPTRKEWLTLVVNVAILLAICELVTVYGPIPLVANSYNLLLIPTTRRCLTYPIAADVTVAPCVRTIDVDAPVNGVLITLVPST